MTSCEDCPTGSTSSAGSSFCDAGTFKRYMYVNCEPLIILSYYTINNINSI